MDSYPLNKDGKFAEWDDESDILYQYLYKRKLNPTDFSTNFMFPPEHEYKLLTRTYSNINALVPNFHAYFYNTDIPGLHRISQNGNFFSTATYNYYLLHVAGPPFWSAVHKSQFDGVNNCMDFFYKVYNSSERIWTLSAKKDVLNSPYFVNLLPWNPTLFHFWLLTIYWGLLQVEQQTSNMRWFPMPVEKAEIVREFLVLIRDFKKRITYGFLLLGEMARIYPKKDPKISKFILEEIVLPTVPLLDFMWEATTISRSLSDLLMYTSDSKFNEEDVMIHYKDYVLSSDVDDFVHIYDAKYWFLEGSPNQMFGKLNSSLQELRTILNTSVKHDFIKNPSLVPEITLDNLMEIKYLHLYNILHSQEYLENEPSLEGRKLYDNMAKLQTEVTHLRQNFQFQVDTMSNQVRMRITLSTLLGRGRDPKLTPSEVNKQLRETVNKTNKRRSRLSLMDIKQKCEKVQLMSVNKSQVLKDMAANLEKTVINPDLLPPSKRFNKRSVPKLAEEFQNRIKTLLYNIAKDNFECLDTEEEVFPDMNYVQFMLPCFVVSFLQTTNSKVKWKKLEKNDSSVLYLANFLHSLVQQHERSFCNFKETRKMCSLDSFLLESTNLTSLVDHTKRLGNSYLPSKLLDTMMNINDSKIEGLPFMSSLWDKLFMASLNALKVGNVGDHLYKHLLIAHLKNIKFVIGATFSTHFPQSDHESLPISLSLTALEVFDLVCIRKKPTDWPTLYTEFTENAIQLVKLKSLPETDFETKRLWHKVNNFVWKFHQFASSKQSQWKSPQKYEPPSYYPDRCKEAINAFVAGDSTRFKLTLAIMSIDKNRENFALLSEEDLQKFGEHECGLGKGYKIKVPCTKQCRLCGKRGVELKMCRVCTEYSDYPDVNWFCSETCENSLLESAHDEEHCQFILNLLGI